MRSQSRVGFYGLEHDIWNFQRVFSPHISDMFNPVHCFCLSQTFNSNSLDWYEDTCWWAISQTFKSYLWPGSFKRKLDSFSLRVNSASVSKKVLNSTHFYFSQESLTLSILEDWWEKCECSRGGVQRDCSKRGTWRGWAVRSATHKLEVPSLTISLNLVQGNSRFKSSAMLCK